MPAKITQVQKSNMESFKGHEIISPAKSVENFRRNSKKSEQNSSNDANFECSFCEKSYHNSISLQRHEIDAHLNKSNENQMSEKIGGKYELKNGNDKFENESFVEKNREIDAD